MRWSQCSRRLREGVRFKLTNLAAAILMAPCPPRKSSSAPWHRLTEASRTEMSHRGSDSSDCSTYMLNPVTSVYFIFQTVAAWINKNDSTNTSMLKKSKITLVGKSPRWSLPNGVVSRAPANYPSEITLFYDSLIFCFSPQILLHHEITCQQDT